MKRYLLAIAALACLLAAVPAWAATMDMQLTPAKIDIGAFYNGETLKVTGTIPERGDLVLRLVGVPEDLHMKQKGKALGLLWMNMGSLEFHNVPNVFRVLSEKPLDQLGDAGADLGLEGLVRLIEVSSQGADGEAMVHELIKLKRSEKLYAENTAEFTRTPAQDGVASFAAELHTPSRLSPGEYAVEAYVIDNGTVSAQSVQSVDVELTGLPKFISNLAFGHGALFGVLAVVAALLAGLAIGLIFQGGSKGAH